MNKHNVVVNILKIVLSILSFGICHHSKKSDDDSFDIKEV